MLAAQAQVKAYQAAMNEFLACIDSELEAQGEASARRVQVADGVAAQRRRRGDGRRRGGVQRSDQALTGPRIPAPAELTRSPHHS